VSLRIQIFDDNIPMLDKIASIHYGQGLDALDHAGTALREATRKAFRSSTTNLVQWYDKNGRLHLGRHGGKIQQRLGHRLKHSAKNNTADNPSNMESFITSNLMPHSMTMVVAGKHKDIHPKARRNGKVIPTKLKTVKAVNKGSYAILKKLNYGDVSGEEYKKVKRPKTIKWLDKKGNSFFRKQNFIEKGRASAMGKVKDIMTNKLNSMIEKQVNRATVKMKQVV